MEITTMLAKVDGQRKERERLDAFLAEKARKHEAELSAGKPLNLRLVKVRRGSY